MIVHLNINCKGGRGFLMTLHVAPEGGGPCGRWPLHVVPACGPWMMAGWPGSAPLGRQSHRLLPHTSTNMGWAQAWDVR